jgi:signal peptidase I
VDSALDHLPEFLLIATLITGVIWGIDRVLWRPRRFAAVAVLEARTPEAERGGDGFTISRDALLREPAIMEWAGSFFPVLIVVLVLRSFIMEPFVIPSGSMIPTLEVGDYILVNKYAYGLRLPVIGTKVVDIGEPQRGEVMVFFPPHKDRYFIKRVVGLPGDLVQYSNKRLIINGEVVPAEVVGESPPEDPLMLVVQEQLGVADHLIQVYPGRRETVREWRVPEGHYFMMGDNRDRSDDSRGWGFVPEANIVGKAVAVWMHKEPGLSLPDFGRNGGIE